MTIGKKAFAVVMAVVLTASMSFTGAMSASAEEIPDTTYNDDIITETAGAAQTTYLDELNLPEIDTNVTNKSKNNVTKFDGDFGNHAVESFKCTRALRFEMTGDDRDYPEGTENAEMSITYNLNGKWNNFAFTLCSGYNTIDHFVEVLGDGNQLYRVGLDYNSGKIDKELDITGVQNLTIKIEIKGVAYYRGGATDVFDNARLTGEGTEPPTPDPGPTAGPIITETPTPDPGPTAGPIITEISTPDGGTEIPTGGTEHTSTTEPTSTDPTTAAPTDKPTDKPVITTTAGGNGTSSQGKTASTASEVSGKVATGDSNAILFTLAMLSLSAIAVVIFRRKNLD